MGTLKVSDNFTPPNQSLKCTRKVSDNYAPQKEGLTGTLKVSYYDDALPNQALRVHVL